ncbi:magnesium transporter [Thioalkalivibrio denitrificans]|uniref:Magnesium transporter MgtE n=1 Tax=Thioalkalivibrio denitrificans TaxID=108003 RepID=A0A1V3NUP3_9GAMM|nr:magnesium transporter [Thioalkalivibrio denitrificans]OOG28837.1 magnesium transporter [Thioalkalivibrio denitrificans]
MNREELLFSVRSLARSLDAVAIAHIVKHTPPSDLVEALDILNTEETLSLLMTLKPQARAELFAHFSEARQDALLRSMPREAVVQLFEHMPSDDRADLYNRLSDEAKEKLLPALAKVERDDILRLASYPEGTVGSVSTSDYVQVSPRMTVTEALVHIRATAPDKETIYVIYVLEDGHKLLGTVSLRELVLADGKARIGEIMRRDPIFARAQWPRAEAVELIRRYDLLALPVINGGERMIGIVTVDDAMDIEKEQDATQLARFGGTATLGGPDLDVLASPFSQMFKVRVFWLVILTFFGILTSTFVAAQEEILTQMIVLAAFIAPIVDMGGNTGSQSATLVIRAMALGELKLKWQDVWFIIKRELPIAAALGAAIAVLEVILAYFAKGVGFDVLIVVGLSMLVCTVLGGVIGALLPFLARRIGTDPATLSSPLITSVMDLLGVFIYFGIAYAFLGELLIGNAV